MSKSGINLAVTQDGSHYNKLKRPDDYFASPPLHPPLCSPTKRTLDQAEMSDGNDDGELTIKRPRGDTASHLFKKRNSKPIMRSMNMDTGMQSMFPGIMDEEGDSDEATLEALAYLRSVRSEAQTIPSLLVANPTQETPHLPVDPNDGNTSVIYEDGTWIACDRSRVEHPSPSLDGSVELDPQEQYYRNLLRRYAALRETLFYGSHLDLDKRKASHPSKCTDSATPRTRHNWLYSLDREYPTPAQIFKMNEDDVFRGLKYCAHSLDRFGSISKQKSCWIWALLAKAPDYGDLDYRRVGSIRDLGHRAGQFRLRLPDEGDEDSETDSESELEEGEHIADTKGHESEHPQTEDLQRKPEEASNEQTKEGDSDHGGEMSISEDGEDGEISDADEPTTLEEARARLLAQLGDRLVRPQEKSNRDLSQSVRDGVASPGGSTHRHNGNGDADQSLESRRDRKTHDEKGQNASGLDSDAAGTSSTQQAKYFASRTEAEDYRKQLLTRSGIDTPKPKKVEIMPKSDNIETVAWNSKVTIDMILTVVAECYGQKDLLRFRGIWADY
ncbi:hypothetical protein BU24DRAFT_488068 [Aaosphaeria arxii CBS 175.79]|uniref:Uncharacterized protein n=1 Tax=Aaosphaeria arxii CBS 175.79 TaxID=1450172 RepID=A0A6A5Y7Y9_9PLEO|nr:uncharacterized protein BU24DRAFT_488068 [Aaosphaeria arxii CBS 175.79]KAF2021695.1 hypothetical protein BU24DRAFT_488068 [Aaosphaeria arxii CBS 175.79]